MNTPLFSVLMAQYNNGRYLEEAVDSVLRQTYQRWELVIVDDGSTDNSREIYAKYRGDERIKVYYNEKNRGCGFTKARCAELAAGEICGYLDPDDTLVETALEDMAAAWNAVDGDVALIASRFYFCDEKMRITGISARVDAGNFVSELDTPHIINHFSTFRKSFYDQTSGINRNIKRCVDRDLFLRLEEVGKVHFLNKALYYYRPNGNSISWGTNRYKADAWHVYIIIDACARRGLPFDKHCEILKPSRFETTARRICAPLLYLKNRAAARRELAAYRKSIAKPDHT